MKQHNYALQKADKPRLRSSTQNIYSVISISAVILKLINDQNHIHFRLIQVLKNGTALHLVTFRSLSSKPEFSINIISPVILRRSRRANAHLLLSGLTPGRVKGSSNPIPKLTTVLIWKTPPCLKFGKTSNRTVENLPQRKLWVWAANDARSRTSASACFFGQR